MDRLCLAKITRTFNSFIFFSFQINNQLNNAMQRTCSISRCAGVRVACLVLMVWQMAAKQLERLAKKAEKEEKAEKTKLKTVWLLVFA